MDVRWLRYFNCDRSLDLIQFKLTIQGRFFCRGQLAVSDLLIEPGPNKGPQGAKPVLSGKMQLGLHRTRGLLRQVGGFPEGSPEGFPEGSPEGSPEATHPHLTKTLWLTLTQSAAAVCAPLSRSSRLVSPDPLGRSPHYPMVSITGSLRIPLDPYGALCDRGCPKGVSKGGTKGKLPSPKGKLPSP